MVNTSLPALHDQPVIDAATRESYARDGHALVKGLLSPQEIAAYRQVITRAVDQLNEETRPLAERDTYGRAFLQIMNLWVDSPEVSEFTLSKRLAAVAAQLAGVPTLRLYHDQALFKEPGGGATPWHQDQYYWPLDTPHTITMWMPLVDISEEVGSMTFATGSHQMGRLVDIEISDESDQVINAMLQEKGMPLHSYGAMRAGDATFHAGWTLHSAPRNQSDLMREVMTVIYFAGDSLVLDPGSNPHRNNDLRTWLPGCRPGEPAASPLNPLLYP